MRRKDGTQADLGGRTAALFSRRRFNRVYVRIREKHLSLGAEAHFIWQIWLKEKPPPLISPVLLHRTILTLTFDSLAWAKKREKSETHGTKQSHTVFAYVVIIGFIFIPLCHKGGKKITCEGDIEGEEPLVFQWRLRLRSSFCPCFGWKLFIDIFVYATCDSPIVGKYSCCGAGYSSRREHCLRTVYQPLFADVQMTHGSFQYEISDGPMSNLHLAFEIDTNAPPTPTHRCLESPTL